MREKKLTRIAAFVLCLSLLLGGTVVLASAAEPSGSANDSVSSSSDELRELLNAISYQEYLTKYADVKRATGTIEVPIAEFTVDDTTADAYKDQFKMETKDGAEALFTPQNGSVSWTIEITDDVLPKGAKEAKFAIRIEYYPDANRSTSIERILKINNKVPFAEARFLTMPKRWVNNYYVARLAAAEGQTLEGLKAAAVEAGFADAYIAADKDDHDIQKVFITYPDYFTSDMTAFAKTHDLRFFETDINGNEIRPTATDEAKWMTYYLKDSTGYTTEAFEFVLEKGENTITIESQNEPMSIKAITLYPLEEVDDYATYIGRYEGVQNGTDVLVLEAEQSHVMSNKTIYPVEDRSNALNSPTDPSCSLLNTIGGEKWATAGQWVEYRFRVNSSGLYDIVSRFRQNVLDGMYTCRSMYLYSEGLATDAPGYYNGAPFAESLRLIYNYNDSWQVTGLSSGATDAEGKAVNYSVYLEKDVTYTIRFEVTLGKMGEVVGEVEDILNTINNCYLEIIKLTGITPDKYRDYGFSQVMPDVMVSLVRSGKRLDALAETLTEIAGEKSSNVATLEKVSRLLKEMGRDDDAVAKNLENLKTYIGTLGTFLSDVRTQPLQLDYITIQPAGSTMPKANPNFFVGFWHEVQGFFWSFFRDYNSMGVTQSGQELANSSAQTTEVWLATARDQSQVIRNLVNNDFTAETQIPVDLKLVAGGTLLPSILAGSGPDVYLGLVQGDVINYAIRSALVNIDDFDDFESYTEANFNEAAMLVLGIEDADEQMHYYGLPETQAFPMMFVRIDILADLNLDVPKTWDDIMACIPTLQANNMQLGLTTDYKIFLYQQGGDLFADDGMRIDLDSKVGLASFEKMCNLFTMYSFPYQYDAANRFRTGEMPILLGDYTGTYNQLKVFATEIEGKWEFMPLPGEINVDANGEKYVNNVSISAVTATVMVKGVEGDQKANAWEFMKWYNGVDCQVDFSNEMVAILGPSAKQAVSNKNALASLPWTTSEYEKVQAQFDNLASVPNYPGAYIIDRYTNFAFLSAFNDNANPSDALMSHISTINKEIERKRVEFNLEVLGDYKDLLTKRLAQINELADLMEENRQYTSDLDALMTQIRDASRSDDAAELKVAADAVRALYESKDPDGSLFVKDRNAVMGYDMDDATLTKAQKKKLRKCFSYEVYKNTDELTTQLKCMVDFLDDAVRLTPEA